MLTEQWKKFWNNTNTQPLRGQKLGVRDQMNKKKYEITLQVKVNINISNYIDERPEGRAGWLRAAIHQKIVDEQHNDSRIAHITQSNNEKEKNHPLNKHSLEPQEPRY